MKIEVLYPEVANLYGELANVTYLKKSCPDAVVVETALNDRPKFLDAENDIDIAYIGTMTESAQIIVLDILKNLKNDIKNAIDRGVFLLATGNALELFGTSIKNKSGADIECLGIFDYHTKRDMEKRYNSLYLGTYGDITIAGFKSQFTHSFYDGEPKPVFMTTRGPGFNPDIKEEGYRYKNFIATYLIGPLFVLNPLFMTQIAKEMGYDIKPAHKEAAMAAYNKRIAEYSEPERGFYY